MRIFRLTTRFLLCTAVILLYTSCFNKKTTPVKPEIIPIPLNQKVNDGTFTLDNNVAIKSDKAFSTVANFAKAFIENGSSITFTTNDTSKKISFIKDKTIKEEEAYALSVNSDAITIKANSPRGAFYGFQSLRQLLPASFEDASYKENSVTIQNIEITDKPQFRYRGMHLDVGRHFFSVAFIKKYIDLMAMLKMNTFHWHLTEDQGWRIEIKKYPKLNEVAAFRKETLIGHYSDQPHQFDGKKYGGYYTQEQVKDIVKYASERQITVIPEIEMPGHSQAALSAYPHLGCTEKPIDVATKWGVFDDIYCTKETTFKFLEAVLDEVMTLFPGKYIHIGGDEAPKTRWKACKNCQQVIKREGLKDEHELQSYFISRMEKYINSKGKQIIGWDEILEGGLAPNATVMSWRGTNGAIVAAKQHHDVILTPGSHCYFDHYQSTNENEPVAIGGFLPLEKVYSFNPIPEELTKEEAKYVLGAQGNVWTEYMKTAEHVEYMAFPRMVALSEVVWSNPKDRNFSDFKNRLVSYFKRLDAKKVNYANHLYEIKCKTTLKDGFTYFDLSETTQGKTIRYTTDGSEPTGNSAIYSQPIKVDKNIILKAATFNDDKLISSVLEKEAFMHLASGKSISFDVQPNKQYSGNGNTSIINGIKGSDKRFGDDEWLGFAGTDVEITIDLGKEITINSIQTRFNNSRGNWIYAPSQVIISFPGSEEYLPAEIEDTEEKLVDLKLETKISTRYVKLKVVNYGIIPDGKAGAGNKPWTFIDEIIIE
ncbi:MAG: family 20 glycosylhydrolase [Flavobacteriaceae bacterium]|nr:family 20 glycosylhydrolase [Flavobacteriaceae bacterium]